MLLTEPVIASLIQPTLEKDEPEPASVEHDHKRSDDVGADTEISDHAKDV